jgi:hypothetical protein
MFGGYSILPMSAESDVFALIDHKGNQVAMGSREVCQTLLFLVNNSPLMERPPQHYRKDAPRPRVRAVAAAAEGGTESDAVGEAGVKSLDGPGSSRAADSIKVSASVMRPEGHLPSSLNAEPYGLLELVHLGSRSVASYWYISLVVAIVIGSALLMWSLSHSL